MMDNIKGAFSAKNYGVSFSKGFKHGLKSLKKSEEANNLILQSKKEVEKAFSNRYDKNSDTLSRLYNIQKKVLEFKGEDIPGANSLMLGGIFGLWTFSLQDWENEFKEKDSDSNENKVFRSNWGVQNERCTAYSEICCQYRQMVLASVKSLVKYVIK